MLSKSFVGDTRLAYLNCYLGYPVSLFQAKTCDFSSVFKTSPPKKHSHFSLKRASKSQMLITLRLLLLSEMTTRSFTLTLWKKIKCASSLLVHTGDAYPNFKRIERKRVFLVLVRWNASPSEGYPQRLIRWYPLLPLGGDKRSTARVKYVSL